MRFPHRHEEVISEAPTLTIQTNMLSTEFSQEIRIKLQTNERQLKKAIKNHQTLFAEFTSCKDPNMCKKLKSSIEDAQQQIIVVGLEQKMLVERLRREHKTNQLFVREETNKLQIERRRFNLSSALSRARKQNIITRTTSVQSSPSEESEAPSAPSTPEPAPITNPVHPQEMTQCDFLGYFGLVTHEVFKEIQNKRAERKRRRTSNPQFIYTKGWDISKRKRKMYLASSISPPNTRQSAKNRNRMSSPPPQFKQSRPESPPETKRNISSIPNLPSGLTIERINQARSNADNKVCIECRLPEISEKLNVCEVCTNGFHVSCHNRPLVQTPRHCPKCYKDLKIGSPTVASNIIDLTEKLKEKQELLDKNKELTAVLTQLQDRHSQLTISLKSQETEKKELLNTQEATEARIKKILTFISSVQQEPERERERVSEVVDDNNTESS